MRKNNYYLFLIPLTAILFTVMFFIFKSYKAKTTQINKNNRIGVTAIPTAITATFPPLTLNPTEIKEVSDQANTDTEMRDALDEYSKKTPLLYLMPVTEKSFKIDYLGNKKYITSLIGEDIAASKQDAINWWKAHDVDPSVLDIVWE